MTLTSKQINAIIWGISVPLILGGIAIGIYFGIQNRNNNSDEFPHEIVAYCSDVSQDQTCSKYATSDCTECENDPNPDKDGKLICRCPPNPTPGSTGGSPSISSPLGNTTCFSGQKITCDLGKLCKPVPYGCTGTDCTGCYCEDGAVRSADYYCNDCADPTYSCGMGVANPDGYIPGISGYPACDTAPEDSPSWPVACDHCPTGQKPYTASAATYCVDDP